MRKPKAILFYSFIFLLGVLLDFFLGGVCKIIWALVYLPAYLAAANALYIKVEHTVWKSHAKFGAFTLIIVAVLTRIIATGHEHRAIYPMQLASANPLTLTSRDWPQTLVVESEALRKSFLPGRNAKENIPVEFIETTNYGCTRSSLIRMVGGINIENDPQSSWAWRPVRGGSLDSTSGPGKEDRKYPWCRIPIFYGG